MALQPLLNAQNKPLYLLRYTAEHPTQPLFVINPQVISNTTGAPNPGPDQEYLPILKEQIKPEYDPRFVIRTESTDIVGSEVHITYSVTDKNKEEVKEAIDNARREEVKKHLPQADQAETLLLIVGILDRQAKQLELTPDEQERLAKAVAVAAKLKQNVEISDNLKELVDAGQKPDIDSSWVAAEA